MIGLDLPLHGDAWMFCFVFLFGWVWGGGSFLVWFLFFVFFAAPLACESFQARDRTHTMAVTQATALTLLDP